MQFIITIPISIITSESSTNAPSKSPVMPPKIFMQSLPHIIANRIIMTGITFDVKTENNKSIMTSAILSRLFLDEPSMTARPESFANGRLTRSNDIPRREYAGMNDRVIMSV